VGGPAYEEYLFEVNVRLLEASDERSRYGLYLNHGRGNRTSLTLAADGSGMLLELEGDTRESNRRVSVEALGSGFRSVAYHQLLVTTCGGKVEVLVDGVHVASGIEVPPGASSVGLLTSGASAAFDGVSVTSLTER
jgi:hypothetical protein